MDIKAKATQQNQMTSINAADKQLKDVAALYEKQFLREMVKQMRSTVSESGLMPTGFAEKYYREQLDHQYVESWGDTGGIGLGKMIYDQLLDRYGAQLGLKLPEQKAQGPLPLSIRDQWNGEVQKGNKAIQFTKKDSENGNPIKIDCPWDGQWLGGFKLENGMQAAKIQHKGVQSILVGEFQLSNLNIGESIKAGDGVGTLAPNAKNFLWRVER